MTEPAAADPPAVIEPELVDDPVPILHGAGELATRPPQQNPVDVYLARLTSHHSRRTMSAALRRLALLLTGDVDVDPRTIPWWELGYAHTTALRTRLVDEGLAPATVNKHLSALRGVLEESWRLGYLAGEDLRRATDFKSVTGTALLSGRQITPGQLRALFAACEQDDTAAGPRDAAILAVLYAGGLRREEASALEVGDVDFEEHSLTVRQGKGRKARITYLSESALGAVSLWLRFRGGRPGALFIWIRRGGHIVEPLSGITAQAIWGVCKKRALQAGVRELSPHDFRRTCASDLLDHGVDLSVVRKLLGHARVDTTARYDRRGERAKKHAAQRLHVPFHAP